MWIPILLVINLALLASSYNEPEETTDGEHSRKILGSSVVTSVSVIMDTGNGTKAIYTDSLGRPLAKPSASSELASPIDLLNPDRYEFYTFDDDGNLVRRLMSLDEIRGIIATGDSDGLEYDSLSSQNYIPENRVNDVLSNVQGVLKGEMELHKNKVDSKPVFDTPDVSDSWSMILPAIFGNSGADINPEKPVQHVTPDTIMIDTTLDAASSIASSSTTKAVPQLADTTTERLPSSLLTLETKENVEIPTTEASSVTSQKEDDAIITASEEVTMTEVSSSPSIQLTTSVQENSSTESSHIPVSSTTIRNIPTTETVSPLTSETHATTSNITEPEQVTTTSDPLLKSSITNSQETPSTVKYLTISSTHLPISSSTERASLMTVTEVSSTERELSTSSTNLPLVRSTEETSAITDRSPTERNQPSSSTEVTGSSSDLLRSSTNIPAEQPSAITEESSSASASVNNPSTLTSSSTNLATEPTSMATLIVSSTSQESPSSTIAPTERTSEDTAPTTERRIISDSSVINETYTTTTPYENNKTPVSTSEIIGQLISTTNSDLETEIVNQILDQSDNRFETTQRNSLTTEIEQTTTDTDMNLMGSIQELVSQTLQNVDEIVLVDAAEITSTMSSPSSSGNNISSEITEPSIYQIISSSSISSAQNVSRGNETIEKSDSPMMKITILNKEGVGTDQGPIKNTKIEKISELNTTQTTEVSKNNETLATITELYNPTEITTLPIKTEKPTADMVTVTEPVNEGQSTESLLEPSIEIIIKESGNVSSSSDTKQPQNTTEQPVIPVTTEMVTTTPLKEAEKPVIKDTDKGESNWTLVPTVKPHAEPKKPQTTPSPSYPELIQPPQPIDLEPKPLQGFGLEDSISTLDEDIHKYSQLCNELAFNYWKTVTTGLSSARSIFVSPFGAISLLAMIFLGARGSTSGEMDEILKLDDMVTFNPHLIFKNVSESIDLEKSNSGVVASAIVRELFSDRQRGMLLPFYKARAKAFYDGFVEEINFSEIGDVIRRRTNLQVKKYSDGKVGEFLKDSFVSARSPLAGISVNVFQTDCSNTSTAGRDGEMHFVVLPSIRQRRLVPIPAVVYRSNFLAGYDPSLDATAVSLGTKDQIVSTILVIPGQQGMPAPGDGLARLEKSLVESSFKTGAWSRLLRSLIPRTGLEVQIPRVIHRSVINATMALKKLGFNELFDENKADLTGMNGVQNELYLSDILQINSFTTCGELRNADSHHSEIYPANVISRRLEKSLDENSLEDFRMTGPNPLLFDQEVPLPLRPRQARVPEMPRLRFDRPFLYFVRHNPTGLILHIGRFNPRLLP
ncbi:unnamed protein product [Phaedon cochleariae]|uniref:Serpin domain-containing protein n=1 Tax=Phaedon cochleariae TaxID=80249 RepID=A0A9N9X5M3_PHACE|nr:unnamed protein product [Phaedon cochleariae]